MNNNKKQLYFTITIIVLLLLVILKNYFFKEEYVIEEPSEMIKIADVSNQDNIIIKEENINNKDLNEESYVTVFISGEVMQPQVIKIENGKRLNDAVELCGGLTDRADINSTNMALVLKEENHYVIPAIGEKIIINNNHESNVDSSNLIDINTANIDELKKLPGVGDVLAQRILDKRNEIGKFKSIEQLSEVSGIGDKKYNDIKDKIKVD